MLIIKIEGLCIVVPNFAVEFERGVQVCFIVPLQTRDFFFFFAHIPLLTCPPKTCLQQITP